MHAHIDMHINTHILTYLFERHKQLCLYLLDFDILQHMRKHTCTRTVFCFCRESTEDIIN